MPVKKPNSTSKSKVKSKAKSKQIAEAPSTLSALRTVAFDSFQRILEICLRSGILKPENATCGDHGCGEVHIECELLLLSQSKMSELNKEQMGKDYATDVLSFPSPKSFQKQGVLGSLAICLPVAKRQAREQGHSVQKELQILLVHGTLHLLGFDHEKSPKAKKIMSEKESEILGQLIQKQGSRGLIARSH